MSRVKVQPCIVHAPFVHTDNLFHVTLGFAPRNVTLGDERNVMKHCLTTKPWSQNVFSTSRMRILLNAQSVRCSRQSCVTLMCALWVCIPGCGCIQTDLGCPRVVQGSWAQLRWEPAQTRRPGQRRSLRCQWVEKPPWWPRRRGRMQSDLVALGTAVVVPPLKHPHTPGLIRNTWPSLGAVIWLCEGTLVFGTVCSHSRFALVNKNAPSELKSLPGSAPQRRRMRRSQRWRSGSCGGTWLCTPQPWGRWASRPVTGL